MKEKSSFEAILDENFDYGYEDGQKFFSIHFVTLLNSIYLFSYAVHVWVELKACK
jgi:hypothetical protein